MDNALATNLNGDYGMDNEDKYYYAAGIRFEKDKEYTVEDYDALPEGARVELINGVFYEMYPDPEADPTERYVVYPEFDEYDELLRGMAAPSSRHQRILSVLCHKIWSYIEKNKGNCEVFPAPFDVWLKKESKNKVEPDISVICDPDKITEKGCEGAPDWIIEIVSPNNPMNDYIRKLNLYLESGVREYWIVDPIKDQITVYNFEEIRFSPTYYTFNDTVKAGIYDDLFIDFKEI